jgi:hypothetical protein
MQELISRAEKAGAPLKQRGETIVGGILDRRL